MNKFLIAALLVLTASCATDSQVSTVKHVELVGHRGAPFDAPENTVASARAAFAQDADAVETDVHLTRDGEVIVFHDSTTRRIDGRDTPIKDLTFAQLRSLDVGAWRGREFVGEKMPTLEELIATVPAGKRLFVEIKTGPEILPALGNALARSHATPSSVVLISFDFDTLLQAHEMWPECTTLWLVGYDASNSRTAQQLIDEAHRAGFSGLDLDARWPLDGAEVNRMKAAGLQLHVWTVDDSDVAKRWIALGVDGITTNTPGRLLNQLT